MLTLNAVRTAAPAMSAAALPARLSVKTPALRLSGEVFGMLINLSGRRRFTSQRLVLYAVLASIGHEGAIAMAREALALFRDAHLALVKGNKDVPGVFCKELEEAYFGNSHADRDIHAFMSLAGRALDALEAERRNAPVLLDELVQSATPLLATLNRVTLVYEQLAQGHAQKMRKQLKGVMADIESIARQARMIAFNAQIVAARAGEAGREFSVVASTLTDITAEIDTLVQQALASQVG